MSESEKNTAYTTTENIDIVLLWNVEKVNGIYVEARDGNFFISKKNWLSNSETNCL